MNKAICTDSGLSIPECSCRRCHQTLLARHSPLRHSADRAPISTSTPPVRIIGSEQRWRGGYRVDL